VNTTRWLLPEFERIPTVTSMSVIGISGSGVSKLSTEWHDSALCRGEAGRDFYPPFGGERKRERVAREQRAKSICAACPVRSQCLEQAIASGERYGVWGGLTFDERVTFRRTA
jgi:WhiB family transcriptional regulator, redox-sensing transcriptional regulator